MMHRDELDTLLPLFPYSHEDWHAKQTIAMEH